MQGRHGDILLVSVGKVPPGGNLTSDGQEAVLALGEVTGHSHTLTANRVLVWDVAGQDYVEVEGEGRLTHEEHGTKVIAPGVYHVIHQREIDLSGEWKEVAD